MRDTQVIKEHIDSKAMNLTQAGEVLARARPILGELWESKIEALHTILADYFSRASNWEQGCILKVVDADSAKSLHSTLINDGTLFSTINGVESFQRFLQAFAKEDILDAGLLEIFSDKLNAHTTLKNPSKKDFKALAEEVIILHNLDQANSKLGDVARTIEHITKTYK